MTGSRVKIRRDEAGPYFEFIADDNKKPIAIRVEFAERKNIGGRADLLARAIGFSKNKDLHVFDANAGLCRDSFHFYCLGCRVTAIEKNPDVYSVVYEHLKQFVDDSRFQLHKGDALSLMPVFAKKEVYDIVYLDPIFQEKKKSAKPSKESQLLRELVAPPSAGDEFELLKVALQSAQGRVVVKRALHAPTLCESFEGQTLSDLVLTQHSITGKAVRYDVYIRKPI
jgi:16S rRNA (guanine1516-N2)-methyltransferase